MSQDKLELEPVSDPRFLELIRANLWRSNRAVHRRHLIDLRLRIASKLAEPGERGVVLFHVDGDCPWSSRNESRTYRDFVRLVAKPVARILRNRGKYRCLSRLVMVMPFYSIEAWLFQNTRVAISILENDFGASHVELVRSWGSDRGLLDEIVQPKSLLPLGSKYNLRLVSDLPVGDVARARKSFFATMERLRRANALHAVLGEPRPIE